MRIQQSGPVCAAVVFLLGCGGGGGSSSNQNALVQGRSEINQLAAGTKPANHETLQEALDLFVQALQQDPNSSEAHFGAAICLAGKIAGEMDGSVTESPAPPVPPAAPGKPGEGSAGGGTGTVGGGTSSPPLPPQPPARPAGKAAANAVTGETEPGEVVPSPPGTLEPAPIPKHRTLGLLWNLDNGLSNPFVLLHVLAPLSDLRFGFVPYYGYVHDNAEHRKQMLDNLNTAAEHLAKVEADANFSVTLPDVDSRGKTVTVGLPEVYLFDAYVQSLRAKLSLSLAYVRDPGTPWNPPTEPRDGLLEGGGSGSSGGGVVGSSGGGVSLAPSPRDLDTNHDGLLTPAEYLPPSPYLTLRDPQLLHTAQQALVNIVDRENKGIEGVLSRPADGAFLVPNVPAVSALLGEVRDKVLPIIQQAATGPFTVQVPRWDLMLAGGAGSPLLTGPADKVFAAPVSVATSKSVLLPFPLPTEDLKVNLAAWFANPPTDLKVFAPTFTLTESGWPDPAKTIYPDKTFGGLFPEGLKDDLPF